MAAVGLLAALGVTTFPAASANAAATPPPQVDLAAPDATVTDPTLSLKPVNTECAPGLVDLNRASASELATALVVPSDPTVLRLIAMRPWLKGSDLSSVPGIGPEREAELAAKTCATQPVLPAPTPRVCASTSQTDLQSATAASITKRLGLPSTTAAALVRARPLSQNLLQVVAPRVPGLSQPMLDGLLSKNLICVTPAPMLASGSAWRWATNASGTVVRRNGFGMIVPPGRVTQQYGAWASVTPLPPRSGVLPTMDSHIYGTWIDIVVVQTPWAFGADGSAPTPLVFHDGTGGTTMSAGRGTAIGVVDGRDTVSAFVSTLSTTTTGVDICHQKSAPATYPGQAFLCPSDLVNGSLTAQWQQAGDELGKAGAGLLYRLLSCPSRTDDVSAATAVGENKFGITCGGSDASAPQAAGTRTWSLYNAAGVDFGGVIKASVIYDYYVRGATAPYELDIPGNKIGDPIDKFLLQALQDRVSPQGLIYPGETLKLTKTPTFETSQTTIQTEANPAATAAYAGYNVVLGRLASMNGLAAIVLANADITRCVAALQDNDYKALFGCLIETVKFNLTAIEAGTKSLPPGYQDYLGKSVVTSLSKTFLAIDIANFSASFLGSFAYGSIGQGAVTFDNVLTKPTHDSLGRNVYGPCLTKGDTAWLVDADCQNAHYATVENPPGLGTPGSEGYVSPKIIVRDPRDGSATLFNPNDRTNPNDNATYFIDESDTYICLAQRYVVDYQPIFPDYSGTIYLSPRATCASNDPTPVISPNTLDPSYQAVILREGGGRAWLVTDRLHRVEIPTGSEFNCWASAARPGKPKAFVYDWISNANLSNFQAEGPDSYTNCPRA